MCAAVIVVGRVSFEALLKRLRGQWRCPSQVCWRYLFGADCIAEERTSAFACALCPLHCCSLEVRQTAARSHCTPCFWACMQA